MLSDDASVEDATLELYKRRLRALPVLSMEELHTLQAHARRAGGDGATLRAKRELWEQAQRIAYGIITQAIAGRRLPPSCGRADVLQTVFLQLGPMLPQWQPECGALTTFLTPRVLGAALRAASRERSHGFTGNSRDAFVCDVQDTAGYEEDYSDGGAIGTESRTALTIGETTAYSDAPQGLQDPAAASEASQVSDMIGQLPTEEANALRSVYGLTDGQPKSLRAAAEQLGLTHPEQVSRLVEGGIKRLRLRGRL